MDHMTHKSIIKKANKSYLVMLGYGKYMTKIFIRIKFLSKTSLERNPSNLSYIFILSVKFENLTVGLNVLIISFILAKFQKNQRSITISLNKC